MTHQKTFGKAVACTIFMFSLFALQISAQTPAPEGQEKPKAEEKKGPKPVKKLQEPCAGGKLVAMHAYSVCGPDKVWHVVEDDYYDCPPVQKFRVYDHATEQPCDKPAPDPIAVGFQQFNGSGCQDFKDIGPMDVYECHDGLWYLVTYEVYQCSDGRRLISFKDRKETGKRCTDPKPELKLPAVTETQTSAPSSPDDRFPSALRDKKVKLDIAGTGETIGPVAIISIQNLTDQPISFIIPPVILESRSRKNQDYVCPRTEDVALNPHESKKIPMDGVCVNRHKPPVGKGVGGDLAINDPAGNIPRDERSHLKRDDSDKLLRIAKSKYDAADKLEDDGLLKDMPYKDKKKRKEIVEQWSMWTDPRISEIEGGPPATKDDLKKVVYKQVPHEMTTDEKKKIDKGIDTIFEKIELTTTKAKDLEKPAENEEVESPQIGGGAINVSNDTPTPGAQTQEKKKKIGKNKKKKKWPQPIQDWVDKKHAADDAQVSLNLAQFDYYYALVAYCGKNSKHWRELRDACDEAKIKAAAPGATQADKDNADKVCNELKKQEDELAKDFNKTEEGQKASDKVNDAQKAADKANAEEKEAGKNIDQTTKDAVNEEEKKHPPVQAVW